MNAKAIALLLFTSAALAGTTVVSTPGRVALRDPSFTPIKELSRHDTMAACEEAAKLLTKGGRYTCDWTVSLAVTVNCDGVAKPVLPRTLDADGFVVKPLFRSKPKDGSDTEYTHEVEDFVAAPYPTCWIRGWRVATLDDWSGTDEDGPAVIVAETWSDAYQALWENPVSVAARALP